MRWWSNGSSLDSYSRDNVQIVRPQPKNNTSVKVLNSNKEDTPMIVYAKPNSEDNPPVEVEC